MPIPVFLAAIGLLLIAYSVRSLFLSLMESRQRRREELSSLPTRQKMPEDLQMYLASEKSGIIERGS